MKILKIALAAVVVFGLSSFVLVQNFNTEENPPIDQKLYQKFLTKFDQVDLPHTIAPEKAKTVGEYFELQQKGIPFDSEKHLGREYSEILPAIFSGMRSRMGPDDFQAEALLASEKHFEALIYSRTPSFREGKTYYVATFDKKGKKVDEISVSGSYYRDMSQATIDKDLNISMQNYEVKGMDGDDEDVLEYILKSSQSYSISPNGSIVKTSDSKAPKALDKQIQQKQNFGAADKKVSF